MTTVFVLSKMTSYRTFFDVTNIDSEETLLNALVSHTGGKPAVVLATALWCGPCKTLKTKLANKTHLSDQDFESATWFVLDVDENDRSLIEELGISQIPHAIVYAGGNKTNIKTDHLLNIKRALGTNL